MLNRLTRNIRAPRARQSGIVLMLALIVLIALTIAGLVLMRSVETSNIIAGNLAFKQAATYAGERGIEEAIEWIETNAASGLLNDNHLGDAGYSANADAPTGPYFGPAAQSWENLITGGRTPVLVGTDDAGNTVRYVIDRLCKTTGIANSAGCEDSPSISTASGNAEEAGEIAISAPSSVYYRITVLAQGPRNTRSVIQAVVAR